MCSGLQFQSGPEEKEYSLIEKVESMKRDSVKKNYLYNLMFQVVNILLPLITTPYISRTLGVGNIGIYSYTYSYVSTFVMVGSLGVGTYGQREIASVNDYEKQYSKKFWEIFIVKMISLIISLAFFIVFSLVYKEYKFYCLIQAPYFIAAILDISWFFQGIEKFKFVAIRSIIVKVVSLIMMLALVKNPDDLYLYILLLCFSQVLGNSTMWISLKKFIQKPDIHISSIKEHVRPTFIYFIPTVAYQIHSVLDKAMLGMIQNNNAENGYYEQANKLVNMATMVISSYNVVMRSRMTTLFAKKNMKDFKIAFNNSVSFISMFVFPMSFGMAGVAANLVPWFFGEGYEKVIILLVVFCPLFILRGLRSCIGSNIITPTKQQSKGNKVQGISAVTNIAMNSVLIYLYASVGATIASVVAEAILLVGYLYYTKEYTSFRMIAEYSYKYLIASLVMFLPIFVFARNWPATMINTGTIVLIGVTVYFSVLLVLKDKYFLNKIERISNRMKMKFLSD